MGVIALYYDNRDTINIYPLLPTCTFWSFLFRSLPACWLVYDHFLRFFLSSFDFFVLFYFSYHVILTMKYEKYFWDFEVLLYGWLLLLVFNTFVIFWQVWASHFVFQILLMLLLFLFSLLLQSRQVTLSQYSSACQFNSSVGVFFCIFLYLSVHFFVLFVYRCIFV